MQPQPLPAWALIPATGSGIRMGADRPKQYLPLAGRTVLEHTLDKILSHPRICGVMLVLSPSDRYWSQLGYTHTKPVLTCHGGKERYHSVYKGLCALQVQLKKDVTVLIHDAVRPLLRHGDLDLLLQALEGNDDGALLGVPVSDTLKQADDADRVVQTHSRDRLWRAFTPQAFRLDLIKQALEQVVEQELAVTDDASAMELLGYRPKLIDSHGLNIKITYPGDLRLAELLLQQGIRD